MTEQVETDSYADRQLGMWGFGFDNEAKNLLNQVHAGLFAAMSQQEKDALQKERDDFREEVKAIGGRMLNPENNDPSIDWVIDEAEKRGVCTADEATCLRSNFINSTNGMPVVI